MILVDTNVWSELTRPRPNAAVLDWLMRHEPQLQLSVIVIAEIRRGYELPKAAPHRAGLADWLTGLERRYAGRTISFGPRDAHILGQLAARRTIGGTMLDTQIAAQGLARGWAVATRNIADMEWTGVQLINPWQT